MVLQIELIDKNEASVGKFRYFFNYDLPERNDSGTISTRLR